MNLDELKVNIRATGDTSAASSALQGLQQQIRSVASTAAGVRAALDINTQPAEQKLVRLGNQAKLSGQQIQDAFSKTALSAQQVQQAFSKGSVASGQLILPESVARLEYFRKQAAAAGKDVDGWSAAVGKSRGELLSNNSALMTNAAAMTTFGRAGQQGAAAMQLVGQSASMNAAGMFRLTAAQQQALQGTTATTAAMQKGATAAVAATGATKGVGGALEDLGGKSRGAGQGVQLFGEKIEAASYKMRLLGGALSVGLTLPIVAAGRAIINAGSDFESGFADVAKVIDGTEQQMQGLSDGLRRIALEVPASMKEITGAAAIGGQLGIGIEGLEAFTETAVRLGVATNMSSEQAADGIARLINIFGRVDPTTAAASAEFERLGAITVDLGNKFATTESEILLMARRIAGIAPTIGMTEEDTLALSAALSSVGLRAEAAGSSITRVLGDMYKSVQEGGPKLAAFAEVAGLTEEAFSTMFQSNPGEALLLFLQGLAAIEDTGSNVFATLADLELNTIRVRDTLLRTTNATELYDRAMGVAASQAALFANGQSDQNALLLESNRRFETFASMVQLVKNRLGELGITIFQEIRPGLVGVLEGFSAGVGVLQKFAEGFGMLPGPVQAVLIGLLGLAAALGPVIAFVGFLAPGLTLVASALKGLASTFGLASAAALGPWGLGIAAVITGTILLISYWDELSAMFPELTGLVEGIGGAFKSLLDIQVTLVKTTWDWANAIIAAATKTGSLVKEQERLTAELFKQGEISDRQKVSPVRTSPADEFVQTVYNPTDTSMASTRGGYYVTADHERWLEFLEEETDKTQNSAEAKDRVTEAVQRQFHAMDTSLLSSRDAVALSIALTQQELERVEVMRQGEQAYSANAQAAYEFEGAALALGEAMAAAARARQQFAEMSEGAFSFEEQLGGQQRLHQATMAYNAALADTIIQSQGLESFDLMWEGITAGTFEAKDVLQSYADSGVQIEAMRMRMDELRLSIDLADAAARSMDAGEDKTAAIAEVSNLRQEYDYLVGTLALVEPAFASSEAQALAFGRNSYAALDGLIGSQGLGALPIGLNLVDEGLLASENLIRRFAASGKVSFTDLETELVGLRDEAQAFSLDGKNFMEDGLFNQAAADAAAGRFQMLSALVDDLRQKQALFASTFDPVIEGYTNIGMQAETASSRMGMWEQKQTDATTAMELLDEQLAAGKINDEQYLARKEKLTWAAERYGGAVIDESLAFVDAQIRQAQYTEGIDAINARYSEAERGSEAYKNEVRQLQEVYDPLLASQGDMTDALTGLADVLDGTVQKWADLFRILGLITDDEYNLILNIEDNAEPVLTTYEEQLQEYEEWNPSTELRADVAPAEKEVNELFALNAEYEGSNPTTNVGVNTEGFDSGYASAKTKTTELDNTVSTPDLVLNKALFDGGMTEAESRLNSAKTGTWYLDLDISRFISQTNYAAGFMPGSLAERGPFSHYPNWDFMFEPMKGSADRGAGAAAEVAASYMPMNSPAEQGPLSKYPNWAFLFEGIDWEAEDAVSQAADAFIGFFSSIEDLASGETLKRVQKELDDLYMIRNIAVETGVEERVIQEIDARIAAKTAELAAVGEVMGTSIVQGIINAANAAEIAQEIIDGIKNDIGTFNLDDLISGDYLLDLTKEVEDLKLLRQMLVEAGVPAEALVDIDAQIAEGMNRIILAGQIIGTETAQNMITLADAAREAAEATERLASSIEMIATNDASGIGAQVQVIEDLNEQILLAEYMGDSVLAEKLKKDREAALEELKITEDAFTMAIASGLITDEELYEMGTGAGGELFIAFYDGIFGEGAWQAFADRWEKQIAYVVDIDGLKGHLDESGKLHEDYNDDVMAAYAAGAISFGDALDLMTDDTRKFTENGAKAVLDYYNDAKGKYAEALISGEDVEEAKKNFEAAEAFLRYYAELHGLVFEDMVADWEKYGEAAIEVVQGVEASLRGLDQFIVEDVEAPEVNNMLKEAFGFAITIGHLSDAIASFAAKLDVEDDPDTEKDETVKGLDEILLDEQLALLEEIESNLDLFGGPDVLNYVFDQFLANLDASGAFEYDQLAFINDKLLAAGLEPLLELPPTLAESVGGSIVDSAPIIGEIIANKIDERMAKWMPANGFGNSVGQTIMTYPKGTL